jgi:hypothetical protein
MKGGSGSGGSGSPLSSGRVERCGVTFSVAHGVLRGTSDNQCLVGGDAGYCYFFHCGYSVNRERFFCRGCSANGVATMMRSQHMHGVARDIEGIQRR